MRCQLRVLPIAGTTRLERLAMGLCHAADYLRITARRLWNDPTVAVRKVRRVLRIARPRAAPKALDPAGLPAGLQPGDRVRIKTAAEIRATLDEHGRYEGLHYVPATMERYCGGAFTVLTRVDKFFDERSRRMLKLKNTVLLEGAYCMPASDLDNCIAGCKRMCFCFWKEAWLEQTGPCAKD